MERGLAPGRERVHSVNTCEAFAGVRLGDGRLVCNTGHTLVRGTHAPSCGSLSLQVDETRCKRPGCTGTCPSAAGGRDPTPGDAESRW